MDIDLERISLIVRQAGSKILELYNTDLDFDSKPDKSPITAADKAASQLIVKGLFDLYPDVPTLTEEDAHVHYSIRRYWKNLFIVDPLDGTQEFLDGTGQFTVNIGLVENKLPIFGLVYAPVADCLYYGGPGSGAYRIVGDSSSVEKINTIPPDFSQPLEIVASHYNSIELLRRGFPLNYNVRRVGSALKFCNVAEGRCHLYLRLTKTYEWDTAAGHALLLGAGGSMKAYDGSPIIYNNEYLAIKPFVASSCTFISSDLMTYFI